MGFVLAFYTVNHSQYFSGIPCVCAVATFHVVVERGPLREGSSAWEQLAEAGKNVEIPEDFQSWAGSTALILEKVNEEADMDDAANGSSEAASVEEEMETTQVS